MLTLLILALVAGQPVDRNAGKEAALSKALLADIERREKRYADPALGRLLARLVARLSASDAAPVHVLVIDTPDPVAGAIPGGTIVIGRGAVARMRSEAELAAVVAHEMAHLQLRHGWRHSQDRPVVVFLGGAYGVCRRAPAGAIQMPLRMQEDAGPLEADADSLAIEILASAGYPAAGLVEVFDRFGASPGIGAAIRAGLAVPGNSQAGSGGTPEFEKIRAAAASVPRRPPSLRGKDQAAPGR
jgi:predicted Zn-dependent protease